MMELGFLFFFNSILLGIGLAMDAFSVSLADGLAEPQMKNSRMIFISGVYAGFQFLMPVIGWVFVSKAAQAFRVSERFIPWISLGLLGYIGGKMILEGIRELRNKTPEQMQEEPRTAHTLGTLILQGIATSIDALSVGFAIAEYDFVMANTAGLIIGAVTFVICVCGLMIGKKAGTRLSWKASVLGGCILIAIGLEIFIKGMI